ncbi:MAG: hypothetical protein NT001_03170 [Candidatus Woesearchaeota archaeon]|nr:hypothetical protein [Candidatus Woesearchaeota archaeon]
MAFILRPKNDVLDIYGKVSYDYGWRAWNTLRLKKDFLKEFPQLTEKSKSISYRMVFYKTMEELEKQIKKLKENKEALPILLWFMQE